MIHLHINPPSIVFKEYYTPTVKFLQQFPDFSLDRPTCFFTEAFYRDAQQRCFSIPVEKRNSPAPPSLIPSKIRTTVDGQERIFVNKVLIQYRSFAVPPVQSEETSIQPQEKELNAAVTSAEKAMCRAIVFIGRREHKQAFDKIIKKADESVNALTLYLPDDPKDAAPAEGDHTEGEGLNPIELHPDNDALAYGYGVLRYVLTDSVTLDRVLFNVPGMLSVRTDNRHNQFCVGTDCAADVVDIVTVTSKHAFSEPLENENGTTTSDLSVKENIAQTLRGLSHAKPRLCACQYRRHCFDGCYGYETTAWRTYRMGGYLPPHVQSNLRAPTPADFAALGLEQAYAHALAHPPPARDRWKDFPITMIVKHTPGEAADEQASTKPAEQTPASTDWTEQTPVASTELSMASALSTMNLDDE